MPIYISVKNRAIIEAKFSGKCAYSGTKLKKNWQVDHIEPILRNWRTKQIKNKSAHNMDNMIPCQRIINHYKGSLDLESFRDWYLGGLHKRIAKLPKKPRTKKSKDHKRYILKVAKFFNITKTKPFKGKFYFEILIENKLD